MNKHGQIDWISAAMWLAFLSPRSLRAHGSDREGGDVMVDVYRHRSYGEIKKSR